jgi:anti-sigma regulatory factor (Ser/Thr protein kinase)
MPLRRRGQGPYIQSVRPRQPDLIVTARMESLAKVRRWLDGTLSRLGASENVRSDLTLAVTELCTNIIRHGYRGDPGMIDLSVGRTGDAIEVVVSDQAPVFESSQGPKIDPDAGPREGGYGIPLIRALADEIAHERLDPRGNRVRLIKHQKAQT